MLGTDTLVCHRLTNSWCNPSQESICNLLWHSRISLLCLTTGAIKPCQGFTDREVEQHTDACSGCANRHTRAVATAWNSLAGLVNPSKQQRDWRNLPRYKVKKQKDERGVEVDSSSVAVERRQETLWRSSWFLGARPKSIFAAVQVNHQESKLPKNETYPNTSTTKIQELIVLTLFRCLAGRLSYVFPFSHHLQAERKKVVKSMWGLKLWLCMTSLLHRYGDSHNDMESQLLVGKCYKSHP